VGLCWRRDVDTQNCPSLRRSLYQSESNQVRSFAAGRQIGIPVALTIIRSSNSATDEL
jgi:hypothetical protein